MLGMTAVADLYRKTAGEEAANEARAHEASAEMRDLHVDSLRAQKTIIAAPQAARHGGQPVVSACANALWLNIPSAAALGLSSNRWRVQEPTISDSAYRDSAGWHRVRPAKAVSLRPHRKITCALPPSSTITLKYRPRWAEICSKPSS
jgi:hypothetical protein